MHAASVHPEPGSNSRKNFISNAIRHLTSSRAIYLSFTFCLSSILNKLWRDQYLHLQCFVLLSCCSIFNDRLLPFLADSLTIIPQPKSFVNTFFQIFQKIFQDTSKALQPCSQAPLEVSSSIILFKDFFVKRFLKILGIFLRIIFQKYFLKTSWQTKLYIV